MSCPQEINLHMYREKYVFIVVNDDNLHSPNQPTHSQNENTLVGDEENIIWY
jgi:hypothetical protein